MALRRTALNRSSPLRSGVAPVRRTPLLARKVLQKKAAGKSSRIVGLAPGVTDAVLERDQHSCSRCGDDLHGVRGVGWSVHHRRPRRMGGDRRPETSLPANLLAVCGSGSTGCHGWIENHRTAAHALGLLLAADEVPAAVPVALWYGVVVLDDRGGFEQWREVSR